MASFVEYIVKIRDLASGQMQKFASNTEGAFNRVSRRINMVGSNVDQLNSRIDALTKTRNLSIDLSQIQRSNREIDQLERKRDRLETVGTRSRGSSMLARAALFGGLALAGAGIGNTLKNGMDRQMAGVSFEVMAGNKQGDELHKNLIKFATDSIYGNEVFGEAKMELGFGVAAKNIMPSMQMLGDIAMGDVEHMKSLTLGFSEAAAAGKLTGRELLIMIDAGFNPLQSIAAKTGRSMGDLRKDMEKGKISFGDLVGAMQYATGPMGRFHNGMQRIGETPTGKWIAFTGALETLSGTIGMQLLPALGGIATFLNGLIGQPQLLENIAAGIGVMAGAWALYTLWTERAAVQTAILEAAAYWPIAVLGLLGYAYSDMDKLNDGYAKSTEDTATRIGNAFTFMRRSFETAIYWAQYTILTVRNLGQMIGKVFEGFSDIGTGDFKKGFNELFSDKTDAYQQRDKLTKMRKWHLAMDYSGLDDDGKPKGKGGLSPMNNGLFDPKAQPGGGAPGGVADTAKGITGGGVRNQTINIAKLGTDTITLHVTNLKEGAEQVKQVFIEMFNQVINSGNAAVSPQ